MITVVQRHVHYNCAEPETHCDDGGDVSSYVFLLAAIAHFDHHWQYVMLCTSELMRARCPEAAWECGRL